MAKKVTYTCDKCGDEIPDVAYKLTCYAEDVVRPFGGISLEASKQNIRQNEAEQDTKTRHLCGRCKDQLTDGLFIV